MVTFSVSLRTMCLTVATLFPIVLFMSKLLRIHTTRFMPEDIYEGDIPRDDTDEATIDLTPDNWDIDDGITAVDKAVDELVSMGCTAPSCMPVTPDNCGHLWFSLADGSQPSGWDGLYTGRLEEVTAHPEGFTPEEVYEIARAVIS